MKPLHEARRDFERAYLEEALEQTNWHRTRAAQLLGMNRTHFQHCLRRLNISTARGARNQGNGAWRSLESRSKQMREQT